MFQCIKTEFSVKMLGCANTKKFINFINLIYYMITSQKKEKVLYKVKIYKSLLVN